MEQQERKHEFLWKKRHGCDVGSSSPAQGMCGFNANVLNRGETVAREEELMKKAADLLATRGIHIRRCNVCQRWFSRLVRFDGKWFVFRLLQGRYWTSAK